MAKKEPILRERLMKINANDFVAIPTNAIPRRFRAEEDPDDYSDDDDELIDAAEDRTQGIEKELSRLGLDIDGRILGKDCFFSDPDKAAAYTPMTCMGKQAYVPFIALFDYFGGHTFMDLNVLAGEELHVVAEEYQIALHGEASLIRIPIKWSLARWVRPRSLLSQFGLIPSCYLTTKEFYNKHPLLFKTPNWYLGVCHQNVALQVLLFGSGQLGSFVIYSPVWLNIDPNEHRPYFLTVVKKEFAGKNKFPILIKPFGQPAKKQQSEDASPVTPVSTESQMMNNKCPGDIAEIKELASNTVTFTIVRSYMGDFELFGQRFLTLYDLVFYYSNNESEMDVLLNYNCMTAAPPFPVPLMPPPKGINVTREIDALPMNCEQWAARQYSLVTEPATLATPYNFISQVFLNPLKFLHSKIMKLAGVKTTDQQAEGLSKGDDVKSESKDKSSHSETRSPKNKMPPTTNMANVPDDRFFLSWTSNIYIPIEKLEYEPEKPLGKGAFGAVYGGKMITEDGQKVSVAIKSQKPLRVVEKEGKLPWLGEVETLTMTCHPNVVALFGCSMSKATDIEKKISMPLLVFELMTKGSLDKYCKTINSEPSRHEALDFGIQIARGVGHLHTRVPSIVHGDLAARNVLVGPHPMDSTRVILKITDLGISKTTRADVHTAYDDPNKIPFKWLPPEVLKGRELTWTTDVWSYGMVLHELYGIGEPYGMLGADQISHLLADGFRFERQPKMPHCIYNIVLQCQRRLPCDRPSMIEIERQLMSYIIESDSDHRAVVNKRNEKPPAPTPVNDH